jgi:hypothetical protein
MHSSREEGVQYANFIAHVIHSIPISAMDPLTGEGGGPLLAAPYRCKWVVKSRLLSPNKALV